MVEELLVLSSQFKLPVPRICTARTGQKSITFIVERKFASFSFWPDGDIVALLSDRASNAEADAWVVTPEGFRDGLQKAVDFLR